MLPLAQIDTALPKNGKITELGCGEGVIAKYLASRKNRTIVGIDSNFQRIPKFKSSNLQFKAADITNIKYKPQDAFVISDVLHHITPAKQKILLKNLYTALNKNGILVIKEIDRGEFLRSHMSRFWDFIFYPKEKIYYWDAKKLTLYLSTLGFSTASLRPCRFFPGSTTLLICRKNAQGCQ